MKHEPITRGKRRPVNVSLAEDTVASARELGINLSRVCERALAAEVKEERDRKWKEDNAAWIAANNAWVEKHGLPLAHLRLF